MNVFAQYYLQISYIDWKYLIIIKEYKGLKCQSEKLACHFYTLCYFYFVVRLLHFFSSVDR